MALKKSIKLNTYRPQGILKNSTFDIYIEKNSKLRTLKQVNSPYSTPSTQWPNF
jgi:hypothetical protein